MAGQYPIDLVLVRHGQSEGNLAQEYSKRGDDSFWTPEFSSRHTSKYRLTELGREHARAAGRYIRDHIYPEFDRYYVSEFVRAMETASLLDFQKAKWFLEFYLREQDRGYLGGKSSSVRESEWSSVMAERKKDSFYWAPPGGESIANACLRVDRVLQILKENCAGFRVLIVAHGNIITGFRVRLERMSQSRYREREEDKSPQTKIQNGGIIHYTRRDPVSGFVYPDYRWVRCICPWDLSLSTNVWQEINRPIFSATDLMAEVNRVVQLVDSPPEDVKQFLAHVKARKRKAKASNGSANADNTSAPAIALASDSTPADADPQPPGKRLTLAGPPATVPVSRSKRSTRSTSWEHGDEGSPFKEGW